MKRQEVMFGILGACVISIVLTFIVWVVHSIATTEWTTEEEMVTGKILRMEYEEGEWDTVPKTKTNTKSDGTTTTETVYVKEWDEPEYEIDFEYYNKEEKETERYFYEEDEASELYEYLKDEGLKRGDEVELLIEKSYANEKYSNSRVIDVRIKGDKFRGMLYE